jgi:hypothetical protein
VFPFVGGGSGSGGSGSGGSGDNSDSSGGGNGLTPKHPLHLSTYFPDLPLPALAKASNPLNFQRTAMALRGLTADSLHAAAVAHNVGVSDEAMPERSKENSLDPYFGFNPDQVQALLRPFVAGNEDGNFNSCGSSVAAAVLLTVALSTRTAELLVSGRSDGHLALDDCGAFGSVGKLHLWAHRAAYVVAFPPENHGALLTNDPAPFILANALEHGNGPSFLSCDAFFC